MLISKKADKEGITVLFRLVLYFHLYSSLASKLIWIKDTNVKFAVNYFQENLT